MTRHTLIAEWCTIILLELIGPAFAGGLSFPHNGAAAAGKANAFAGEANDPSAIFYNPAGITQLPDTQVMAGLAITYFDTTFRSSTTGESTHLQDQFPLVPHLYVTHRFKALDERLSVGVGIYHPFGIVVDWPDTWQGRFNSTNARLRVTIFNPTVAFRATPKLSLAAGIRIADVGAEFEQKIPVGGESKVRVHDLTAHPVGWNVGVLYQAIETISLGLTFRSEMQAKLQGRADFTGPASAFFTDTGFRSNLKLPPQLVGGISLKVIPRWTINADVEWEGWRTLGSLPKDFEGTTALDSPGQRLWKNSYVYRIGAEYAATQRIALRGGYFYDQTPIPANTFDPTIPTASMHVIAAGLGYKWNTTILDIAYLIGFFEKRSIDNGTLDPTNIIPPTTFGSYSTKAHVVAISLTKRF